MSHARCPCATPGKASFTSRSNWRPASVKHSEEYMIPEARFDRATSELWAPRSSSWATPVYLLRFMSTARQPTSLKMAKWIASIVSFDLTTLDRQSISSSELHQRQLPFMSSLTIGFCKTNKVIKYRRYVSIVCPRGYEPRALPLRHVGEIVL